MEERKALLGSANPLQRAQQLSTQADLANSATDTTASLQRTRQLMAEVTCPLKIPRVITIVWPVLHASSDTCQVQFLTAGTSHNTPGGPSIKVCFISSEWSTDKLMSRFCRSWLY